MMQTYEAMGIHDLDELEVYRFLMFLPLDKLKQTSAKPGLYKAKSVAEAKAYEEALESGRYQK